VYSARICRGGTLSSLTHTNFLSGSLVALLTMKIRNVWSHLIRSKKDIHGRRPLRLLIHQRAKMLKYLKRVDRDRYDQILERCALEPGAVEGELVV
jgi:small subunit ribosomal protein S15